LQKYYRYKNYDCILPSVTTDKAQLRIRANDSENGASEYVLSNIFSVAKQLYVIKDGNINKSYKMETGSLFKKEEATWQHMLLITRILVLLITQKH
jgi:hypothetical protein